jgi:hypothetical protein
MPATMKSESERLLSQGSATAHGMSRTSSPEQRPQEPKICGARGVLFQMYNQHYLLYDFDCPSNVETVMTTWPSCPSEETQRHGEGVADISSPSSVV